MFGHLATEELNHLREELATTPISELENKRHALHLDYRKAVKELLRAHGLEAKAALFDLEVMDTYIEERKEHRTAA